MKGKCKSIGYKPGSFSLIQGIKKTQSGKTVGGKHFEKRGHG